MSSTGIGRQVKRTGIVLLVMAALGLTASCRKEYTEKLIPLTLTVEKEYRFDIVASWAHLAGTDDPTCLYVSFFGSQQDDCRVYRLNTDLQVQGKYIIKKGQGPGEARNPHIYGGDEKSVLVYAPPDFKFIEFDRDFNVIREFRVRDLGTPNFSGFRYFPGKRLVLDSYHPFKDYYRNFIRIYTLILNDRTFAGEKKIFETDYSWRRKDNRKSLWAFPFDFTFFKDHIYLLDKRDYRLKKLDLNGKVSIDKAVPYRSRTADKATRKNWLAKEYPDDRRFHETTEYADEIWPASWLLPLGDGIAVARCESYDPDIEPGPITADYFDPDLNLLGQVQLPYFPNWNHPFNGHSLVDKTILYRDGKLYMLIEQDEGWLLIRYGVNIGEIKGQTGEKHGV